MGALRSGVVIDNMNRGKQLARELQLSIVKCLQGSVLDCLADILTPLIAT